MSGRLRIHNHYEGVPSFKNVFHWIFLQKLKEITEYLFLCVLFLWRDWNRRKTIHPNQINTGEEQFEQVKVKVKWSRYRPGVAQRVGRGLALLFHDRGTRRGWVVSSTLRPHFTPGKDPVTILQEAGWAPGPVWTSGKSRPHRDSIPDRPARSSVAILTELPGPLFRKSKFI